MLRFWDGWSSSTLFYSIVFWYYTLSVFIIFMRWNLSYFHSINDSRRFILLMSPHMYILHQEKKFMTALWTKITLSSSRFFYQAEPNDFVRVKLAQHLTRYDTYSIHLQIIVIADFFDMILTPFIYKL
jgi:hypothetical protein